MRFLSAAAALVCAQGAVQGSEKPAHYKLANLTKGWNRDIKYQTYEEVVAPLRKRLDKGKLEESEFKIEEGMIPKGGILSATLPISEEDPIVKLILSKDSTRLFVCDDANQKPGLSTRWSGGKLMAYRDEEKPIMTFECGIKKPLPDTFNLELETAAGEIQGRFGFYKQP